MTHCCGWCGANTDDAVEIPADDDRGPVVWWCRDSAACQSRRAERPVRQPRRILHP